MATLSIRFTHAEDVARWEKLEAKGKLGTVQKRRLEAWRRTNGQPLENKIGWMILDNAVKAAKGE